MKTLKISTVSVLVCIMLVSLILPAFADVIVEPADSFYTLHRDECVYNNYRTYIVNTNEGHAYLYVSPDSAITVEGYSNGEKVGISWLYTDKKGEVWGVLSHKSGWFRMSDLSVVYDSFSFSEEHSGEMQKYIAGSYTVEATEEKPVIMWKYPGNRYELPTAFRGGNIAEYVSQTYTDAEGNVWGYIVYYMGHKNIWVCLSDPYGEKVNATADGDLPLKAEPTPPQDIPLSEGNKNTFITVGALVGGVLLLTAVLITAIFVKKKKN